MDNEKTSNSFSRRKFLQTTAGAAAAFTIIPNVAMGKKLGHQAPSDTLNVALIGSGNQGSGDISSICKPEVAGQPNAFGMASKPGTENLATICDVDWGYGPVVRTFEKYPSAKKYKDWRKMFDELEKSIGALVVATADHSQCFKWHSGRASTC